MTDRQLVRALRKLARLRQVDFEELPRRGKGAHRMIMLDGRRTTLPSPGELKTGTLHAILGDLGLTADDLKN